MRLLLAATLLLLTAGCRSGPQPPDAADPPTPGYQRVQSSSLSYTVDVPEGWKIADVGPGLVRLERPRRGTPRWQLYLFQELLGQASKGEEEKHKLTDEYEDGLLQRMAPAGASLQLLAREEQRTGWLAGRLIGAEATLRKERRLLVLWIGVHADMLYAIGGGGPPAAQLEIRETLDHAIASLRPSR
jgi:hypothetical protein